MVAERTRLARGGFVAVDLGRHQLRRPAVVAGVARCEEAAEAVVEARRTDLVAGRSSGHLVFHLSIIGIASNFVETDV
jgi:hypothetical protein